MALGNPYASALKVSPEQEKAQLLKLKNDPQKMQELGLAADEDFSLLKNDPVKYNRVLSYVKGETYKSPAYQALESGQTRSDFVSGQLGDAFKPTPFERMPEARTRLEGEYNVEPLRQTSSNLQAGLYSAPTRLRDEISRKGGYDIEGMKDTFEGLRTEYATAYRDFVEGRMSPSQYASLVSRLSTAARSLEKGQTQLGEQVERGLGEYKEQTALASSAYENAYAKFQQALQDEQAGYSEARVERKEAAQEMFDAARELLDQSMAEERGELREIGGDLYQVRWNSETGKHEFNLVKAKPRVGRGGGGGGGGGGSNSKLFRAADGLRSDLAKGTLDWGQAWNLLKAQFKDTPNNLIDAALGGSAGYDPGTGTFDQKKATGFAIEGRRGAMSKPEQRSNAYADLNSDLANIPSNYSGAAAYNMLLEAYGSELNDSEIKAAMRAKGINPDY